MARGKALVGLSGVALLVLFGPVVPGRWGRAQPAGATATAGYRLPNGWALDPAGRTVETSRSPTGLAVSPDGQTVAVVGSGVYDEDVAVLNARTLTAWYTPASQLWQGVAFDGNRRVWVSGGSFDAVFPYRLEGGAAVPSGGGIAVPGYPGNMLAGPDGTLYVLGNISMPASGGAGTCPGSDICSVVSIISPPSTARSPVRVPVGRDAYGLALNPHAGVLYVTNWADSTNPARAGGTGTVSVVDVADPATAREVQVIPVGHDPTGIALSPDGRELVVTNSADDSLSVIELDGHGRARSTRTVSLRVSRGAPLGTTPLAVAFGARGSRLFVDLAGLNAVEVLTGSGRPIPQHVTVGGSAMTVAHTWIPTGWYPDALAVAPNPTGTGSRLYVTNLKGVGSGPGTYQQLSPVVGTMTEGSLSVVDLPASLSAPPFAAWTGQTVANDHLAPVFDRNLPDPATDPCLPAPLPGGAGVTSQLLCAASHHQIDPRTLHVVIINNENKDFDDYFGDIGSVLPGANADPAFTRYGAAVTTNQHALAETFALDDNFFSDGESSVLGHSWLTAGYTTEYNELTWGPEYDLGLRGDRSAGEYSGNAYLAAQGVAPQTDPRVAAEEKAMVEPRQRIFDVLADPATNPLRLSERIYSDDLNPASAATPDQVPLALWGLGPDAIGGSDITFPDVDRAEMFLHGKTTSHAWDLLKFRTGPPATFGKTISFNPADQAKFTLDGWTGAYDRCRAAGGSDATCQRAMPNLSYLVFPENHTYVIDFAYNPLDPSRPAMVADNDYAIGLVTQGLSRSPFWKNTLVLLTEDDPQNSGDHVDIHRTFVLASGGLARRLGQDATVSSQVGSYPSILKTAETLLGIPPMTLFDWRAIPLASLVAPDQAYAASAPSYSAVPPSTPFLVSPPVTALPPDFPSTLVQQAEATLLSEIGKPTRTP